MKMMGGLFFGMVILFAGLGSGPAFSEMCPEVTVSETWGGWLGISSVKYKVNIPSGWEAVPDLAGWLKVYDKIQNKQNPLVFLNATAIYGSDNENKVTSIVCSYKLGQLDFKIPLMIPFCIKKNNSSDYLTGSYLIKNKGWSNHSACVNGMNAAPNRAQCEF